MARLSYEIQNAAEAQLETMQSAGHRELLSGELTLPGTQRRPACRARRCIEQGAAEREAPTARSPRGPDWSPSSGAVEVRLDSSGELLATLT